MLFSEDRFFVFFLLVLGVHWGLGSLRARIDGSLEVVFEQLPDLRTVLLAVREQLPDGFRRRLRAQAGSALWDFVLRHGEDF